MPAIVLDPSCRILADALASRVCYREQVSELEKITVDLVYRPHAFGDIWMALAYLLASNEYMELREPHAFEQQVYMKENAAWLLRQELRNLRAGEAIAIGTDLIRA